ncbi:glycosyltransferase family 2 protein [Shewanella sp.]|uniref:glycosyltransferase family 2 protein n=1 Tax=Shewanella sp. TaxID=50422 RepID=UPI003D0ADF28
MIKVFIAVVSHGHENLIKDLGCIQELLDDFTIVVKSNKVNENFNYFHNFNNFHWINESYGLGFGANNNVVFNYCLEHLGMTLNDFFLVLNPDVLVDSETIKKLLQAMTSECYQLSAINLYRSYEPIVYDYSVRMFPTLYTFGSSFLGAGNKTIINKDNISVPTVVDWAAGSFLMFRAAHYKNLRGFDENYFMYCEDIDICARSKKLGEAVIYYPDLKALHLAKHANRSIFSKHFYWHLQSALRFVLSMKGMTKIHSSINFK